MTEIIDLNNLSVAEMIAALRETARNYELAHHEFNVACKRIEHQRQRIEVLEQERDSLKEQLEWSERERLRLKRFCDEFVWGEDNPDLYENEMAKLKQERDALKEAITHFNNEVLLAVYDLSIANAPIPPKDARLIADDVARQVGTLNAALSPIKRKRKEKENADNTNETKA